MQLPAPAWHQCLGDSSTISYTRVSVLQLGGSGDLSGDTLDNEPHFEALTRYVTGCISVPVAPAAAEVTVLINSGSGVTGMSQELVEALRRQPEIIQTALTNAFVSHARVMTSFGQECDIVTKSCPLYLTVEITRRLVRSAMPFIVFPGREGVVNIGQKNFREKLEIDLMAQLKA